MAHKASETVIRIVVKGQLAWQVAVDPQSDLWIGVCERLNLHAVGETMADFQQCANDAIALLFADLFETGELDAFLRSRGWNKMEVSGGTPGRTPRFDVPAGIHVQPHMADLLTAHA